MATSISITFEGKEQIAQSLQKTLEQHVADSAQLVLGVFQNKQGKITPVKTGRARDGWTETHTKTDYKIENKVPYIGYLEQGRSKQAPKGMIGPALGKLKGKI
jgi:hypothetical protein